MARARPRARSLAAPRLTGRSSQRRYLAYGLTIQSHFPLDSLPASRRRRPQVVIDDELDDAAPVGLDGRNWFSYAHLPDGATYLRWRDHFDFVVAVDGRQISGRRLGFVSAESFETHFLSQVLSTAMLRMGFEPIHATVVDTRIGAVGILGDSGFGKSSLAATFLAGGSRLVTDDLMVVGASGGAIHVHPGPRRIKLMPSAARRLLGSAVEGVAINDRTRKMVVPLPTHQVATEPRPLACLLSLARPASGSPVSRVRVRRLSARSAFVDLTRNSFNSLLIDADRLRVQFSTASLIASSVPVFRLSYPAGLSQLPDVGPTILGMVDRALA